MDASKSNFVLAIVYIAILTGRMQQPTNIQRETRATLLRLVRDNVLITGSILKPFQLDRLIEEMERSKAVNAPSNTGPSACPGQSMSEPQRNVGTTFNQSSLRQATKAGTARSLPTCTISSSVRHSTEPRSSSESLTTPSALGPTATTTWTTQGRRQLQQSYRTALSQEQENAALSPFGSLSRSQSKGPVVGRFAYPNSAEYLAPVATGYSSMLQPASSGTGFQTQYQNAAGPSTVCGQVGYQPISWAGVSQSAQPVSGSRFPFSASQNSNLPELDAPRQPEIGPERTDHDHKSGSSPYASPSHLRCELANCDIPNYCFKSMRELTRHQECAKSHCEAPPNCPVCGKQMSRTDSLRRHIRNIHFGEYHVYYRV